MSVFDFLLKRTLKKNEEVLDEEKDSSEIDEVGEDEVDETREDEVDETKNFDENEESNARIEAVTPIQKFEQTIFGIRFPWEAWTFLVVGALSEVVDALFMINTLDTLSGDYPLVNIIISVIVAAGCFFSMAFAGFQLGNRRYYSKLGITFSYAFWATAGLALVISKIFAGLVGGGLDEVLMGDLDPIEMLVSGSFISNLVIAIIQFVLYVGTGFMTRDSMRILTDNDIREYFKAKRDYKDLIDELSERRGQIVEDVSKLKSYPKYAKRLLRSRQSVMKNVAQYNEAARALIEAKMAITVDPALMEEMYDSSIKKEGRSKTND